MAKINLLLFLKRHWEPNLWFAIWLTLLFYSTPQAVFQMSTIIVILLMGAPIYALYFYGSFNKYRLQFKTTLFEMLSLVVVIGIYAYLHRDTLPERAHEIVLLAGLVRGIGLIGNVTLPKKSS